MTEQDLIILGTHQQGTSRMTTNHDTPEAVETMVFNMRCAGLLGGAKMLRRLHQRAVDAEQLAGELQGLLVTHEICADRIKATARADALREAHSICARIARFAATGGPHSCTSINGALWYGREQYARQCADEIDALINKEPRHD